MVDGTGEALGIQTVLLVSVPSLFIMLYDASQASQTFIKWIISFSSIATYTQGHKTGLWMINIYCFLYVYKTYLQKLKEL